MYDDDWGAVILAVSKRTCFTLSVKSQDTRESQESVIMIVFQFRLLEWEAVIRNELRLGIGLSIINAQSSNVIEKPIPKTHWLVHPMS
jgi:hypothetical protein